jgi:hypothetical protein
MENAIVAASNCYALRALLAWPSFSMGHLLTSFAMAASLMYHLVERHKHNMPGLVGDGSVIEHNVYLNLDRVAALALAIHLINTVTSEAFECLAPFAALSLTLCAASELSHWWPSLLIGRGIGIKTERRWYVVTHSLWHLCAFHLVYLVARDTKS